MFIRHQRAVRLHKKSKLGRLILPSRLAKDQTPVNAHIEAHQNISAQTRHVVRSAHIKSFLLCSFTPNSHPIPKVHLHSSLSSFVESITLQHPCGNPSETLPHPRGNTSSPSPNGQGMYHRPLEMENHGPHARCSPGYDRTRTVHLHRLQNLSIYP
jgi:hypothetical protein